MNRDHTLQRADRIEFSATMLRSGAERVIRGFVGRSGAAIDIVCRDCGREFGRLSFRSEHTAVLALAIAEARTGHGGTVRIAELAGREITIRIEARGRHGAVMFTRLHGGEEIGRPITLHSDEVDALERATDWLTQF